MLNGSKSSLAVQRSHPLLASPAEKLPRWKASELTAAHRSRSLGLPDKHFRKSFQKNNLDIHYLSQPSRAHSPGLPWCFQRGLWPEWQRCEAQIRHWEGIKQWSRERKQPVAAVGFAFRLGHNQSGSPLFSCSRLCLSALWRSQLSSGSSAQTLVLSFLQKINPSTNQRIIPGSAHCCSQRAHGQAAPSGWGRQLCSLPGDSVPAPGAPLLATAQLWGHRSLSPGIPAFPPRRGQRLLRKLPPMRFCCPSKMGWGRCSLLLHEAGTDRGTQQ